MHLARPLLPMPVPQTPHSHKPKNHWIRGLLFCLRPSPGRQVTPRPQPLTCRWAQNLPVLPGPCRRMHRGPGIRGLNLGPSRPRGLSAPLQKSCLPGIGGQIQEAPTEGKKQGYRSSANSCRYLLPHVQADARIPSHPLKGTDKVAAWLACPRQPCQPIARTPPAADSTGLPSLACPHHVSAPTMSGLPGPSEAREHTVVSKDHRPLTSPRGWRASTLNVSQ